MDAEKGSVARWGLHCLLRLDRIESGEVLMKEETKMRTTAQVLVDCLEAEGVDVIFGIPGEETLDLMFAIRDSKIRFIPVRHEQGAAFMADVYGRLTGRAGVCLSTLGPGATNLVTGVADAYLDGAPLVAITGQVGTDRMQLTSHQYLDLTAMFEPITKRSKQIIRPDTVGEIVRLAFKHAEKGKPGATHIDLPQNIAKMPADAVPLKRQQVHDLYADPTHIAASTAMWTSRTPISRCWQRPCHCKGYRVEKAEDLIPTLEEAFRQDVPSVIVVPVDYSENMKLSEHLKEVYTKKQEAII